MAVLDDILYSCFSVLYIKQVEDHAKKMYGFVYSIPYNGHSYVQRLYTCEVTDSVAVFLMTDSEHMAKNYVLRFTTKVHKPSSSARSIP